MKSATDTLQELVKGLDEATAAAGLLALRPVLGGAAARRVAERVRLPAKRSALTQKARVGGQPVHVRVGVYGDGSIGELFVDMHKIGAFSRGMLHALAITISIALQHGVPLDAFVHALSGMSFAPHGDVEGDEAIDKATSIADYIIRAAAALSAEARAEAASRTSRRSP